MRTCLNTMMDDLSRAGTLLTLRSTRTRVYHHSVSRLHFRSLRHFLRTRQLVTVQEVQVAAAQAVRRARQPSSQPESAT